MADSSTPLVISTAASSARVGKGQETVLPSRAARPGYLEGTQASGYRCCHVSNATAQSLRDEEAHCEAWDKTCDLRPIYLSSSSEVVRNGTFVKESGPRPDSGFKFPGWATNLIEIVAWFAATRRGFSARFLLRLNNIKGMGHWLF